MLFVIPYKKLLNWSCLKRNWSRRHFNKLCFFSITTIHISKSNFVIFLKQGVKCFIPFGIVYFTCNEIISWILINIPIFIFYIYSLYLYGHIVKNVNAILISFSKTTVKLQLTIPFTYLVLVMSRIRCKQENLTCFSRSDNFTWNFLIKYQQYYTLYIYENVGWDLFFLFCTIQEWLYAIYHIPVCAFGRMIILECCLPCNAVLWKISKTRACTHTIDFINCNVM